MRITFVIQDLVGCGAQYVTALMVRGFVAKGYEVDLIVSRVHQVFLRQPGAYAFGVPEKTRWIVLPHDRARKNIGALRNYLRTTDSVAVIAMSSNYTTALGMAAWGLRKRPKLVHVEHKTIIDSRRRAWEWFVNKIQFAYYDCVLAVSAGTAEAFRKRYPYLRIPVHVVYNPVIDEIFYQKVQAKAPLHVWLAKKTCPTFVAAGAHTPFKNHGMLLEAVRLCQKSRKIRLVLFGRGELTQQYQAFVAKNHLEDVISIAGYTDNLPLQLRGSDGFLIASNVESFSVVCVEALACGVPVISTDCPFGPPEILGHGMYGTLVPIGDADAMAQAILRVVSGERREVPETAWKRFSLEGVVLAYEQAIGLVSKVDV